MAWTDQFFNGSIGVTLPPDVSYGAIGGPSFSTGVTQAGSGYVSTVPNWVNPSAKYQLVKDVMDKQTFDNMKALFMFAMGKAFWFYMRDWSDYQFSNEPTVADPITGRAQIVKRYPSGPTTYVRRLAGFNRISGYATTGMPWIIDDFLTGASNPDYLGQVGGGTCSGTFLVPVRFDTDWMDASLDEYQSYSWKSIPLVEVDIWKSDPTYQIDPLDG